MKYNQLIKELTHFISDYKRWGFIDPQARKIYDAADYPNEGGQTKNTHSDLYRMLYKDKKNNIPDWTQLVRYFEKQNGELVLQISYHENLAPLIDILEKEFVPAETIAIDYESDAYDDNAVKLFNAYPWKIAIQKLRKLRDNEEIIEGVHLIKDYKDWGLIDSRGKIYDGRAQSYDTRSHRSLYIQLQLMGEYEDYSRYFYRENVLHLEMYDVHKTASVIRALGSLPPADEMFISYTFNRVTSDVGALKFLDKPISWKKGEIVLKELANFAIKSAVSEEYRTVRG